MENGYKYMNYEDAARAIHSSGELPNKEERSIFYKLKKLQG